MLVREIATRLCQNKKNIFWQAAMTRAVVAFGVSADFPDGIRFVLHKSRPQYMLVSFSRQQYLKGYPTIRKYFNAAITCNIDGEIVVKIKVKHKKDLSEEIIKQWFMMDIDVSDLEE